LNPDNNMLAKCCFGYIRFCIRCFE